MICVVKQNEVHYMYVHLFILEAVVCNVLYSRGECIYVFSNNISLNLLLDVSLVRVILSAVLLEVSEGVNFGAKNKRNKS